MQNTLHECLTVGIVIQVRFSCGDVIHRGDTFQPYVKRFKHFNVICQ